MHSRRLPLLLLGAAAAIAAAVAVAVPRAASAQVFAENATTGIVAIEAESYFGGVLADGWQQLSSETGIGARGASLRFAARPGDRSTLCSSPTGEAEGYPALTYRFRIAVGGNYQVMLRMLKTVHCVDVGSDGFSACHTGAGCVSYGVQSDGDMCLQGDNRCWRTDISNDVFVRLRRGVNGTAVPFDAWRSYAQNQDICKLFVSRANEYAWSVRNAMDPPNLSAHQQALYALPPGDYTYEVRGRSVGCGFDRLIIFNVDQGLNNENEAKASPESALATGPAPTSSPSPPPPPGSSVESAATPGAVASACVLGAAAFAQ